MSLRFGFLSDFVTSSAESSLGNTATQETTERADRTHAFLAAMRSENIWRVPNQAGSGRRCKEQRRPAQQTLPPRLEGCQPKSNQPRRKC
eukprot:95071-Alexandrium_andersonii.AAC.1